MNLLIISGFLGSGKTTVLLALARRLADTGQKVAVIENEVGKTGIDGQLIQAEGLSVRELYSGCVCCQLRIDLLNTLYELERNERPDVVIVEPSGVASARQVTDGLIGYGGDIRRTLVVTLIDAVRFRALELFGLPLVETGIAAADLVVVNKIDEAEPAELERLETRIRDIRPGSRIVRIAVADGTNVPAILNAVEDLLAAAPAAPPATPIPAVATIDQPIPAVYARKFDLTFAPPVPADTVTCRIAARVTRLADDLQDAGGTLLGHIKAILRPAAGGYYLFNLTRFGTPPRQKGGLPPVLDHATLTVNAIVYGLDPITLHQTAERVFTPAIQEGMSSPGRAASSKAAQAPRM